MTHRNWTYFLAALCTVVLLVTVYMIAPTAYPPRERPMSVAELTPTLAPPPLPSPQPTSKSPPPHLYVSLSPYPLSGTPPLTAKLTADLYGSEELERACTALRWELGDGTAQDMPCTTNTNHPSTLSLAHTYGHAGTYHARVTAVLQDGQEFESNTQTIVVAMPQPTSPVQMALLWGVWGLTLVAAYTAFWLFRRMTTRARHIGYAALALGLVTFVPPFSYIPNPVGLAWAVLGHYRYDPRLPFVNRFVIAGDPTSHLRPYLDGLIGQTGLDPLDPTQPLARYEFVEVRSRGRLGAVKVTTRLTYDDGRVRTYDIPLYQFNDTLGFYQRDWRYDGLGRLRTEHRELPGTPFLSANSPVHLATPQPLTINPQARELDALNLANWGPMGYMRQHLVWSPQGDAFLMTQTIDLEQPRLWLVQLDGSPPRLLADYVRDYAWMPDGQAIVFTSIYIRGQVSIISRDGKYRVTLPQGLVSERLPGLTNEGVWYARDNALWLAPIDGSEPRRIANLPELTEPGPTAQALDDVVRPSPDGTRVAYTCRGGLCLQDRDGSHWAEVAASGDVSWSRDGSRLAVVQGDQSKPATLTLLKRDGAVERAITIAPNGPVDAPQWTPDGKRLFVQTYPFNGRRILTVNIATGEALDLSQPRWDAWFALAADGKSLLLTNGRGGFWMSEIIGQDTVSSGNQGNVTSIAIGARWNDCTRARSPSSPCGRDWRRQRVRKRPEGYLETLRVFLYRDFPTSEKGDSQLMRPRNACTVEWEESLPGATLLKNNQSQKQLRQRPTWFSVLLLLDAFVVGGLAVWRFVLTFLENAMTGFVTPRERSGTY